MTIPNRDIQILQKIQGYCDDIMFTHTEYDRIGTRLRSAFCRLGSW